MYSMSGSAVMVAMAAAVGCKPAAWMSKRMMNKFLSERPKFVQIRALKPKLYT